MSPDSLSSGPATRPERYGSQHNSGYRSRSSAVADNGESHNGTTASSSPVSGPTAVSTTPAVFATVSTDKPRLPSLDPAAPPEPVFTSGSWLDADTTTSTTTTSLADHPLLRGLLLELPPKGSTPPPDWLDRWFEATRSILELLYVK